MYAVSMNVRNNLWWLDLCKLVPLTSGIHSTGWIYKNWFYWHRKLIYIGWLYKNWFY